MYFCPTCSNLLLVQSDGAQQQLYCQTCPYIYPVVKTIVQRKEFTTKATDDVLGGDGAWANVQKTPVKCPRCDEGEEAYFMQIQTRSADEPSTVFYKCVEVKCGWQWKEQ